ncbi:hypothetical protein KBX35_19385 [Micromonospora sp. C32]|uniref:hypothetical protein n=1 Tax=unclassified Micromonospora TaxID=2617518 RepID=UPI001B35A704|nr:MULTISPECIES: hypothetical protein [unclassified Micromonospora]MBQ1045660.1 hypothetical protein [Micromonospora sp. C72]MBQ1056956.1 hypothetical protein [Micromonospora sp. C32]
MPEFVPLRGPRAVGDGEEPGITRGIEIDPSPQFGEGGLESGLFEVQLTVASGKPPQAGRGITGGLVRQRAGMGWYHRELCARIGCGPQEDEEMAQAHEIGKTDF